MPEPVTLHATTVAFGHEAVLLLGPSGSGKSALGLQLMALGARLVADDQTRICRRDASLIATCPPALAGLIEARGVGILRADPLDQAEIILAIDLAQTETDRLPPRRSTEILGCTVALLHNSKTSHFPAAIAQYMLSGRSA